MNPALPISRCLLPVALATRRWASLESLRSARGARRHSGCRFEVGQEQREDPAGEARILHDQRHSLADLRPRHVARVETAGKLDHGDAGKAAIRFGNIEAPELEGKLRDLAGGAEATRSGTGLAKPVLDPKIGAACGSARRRRALAP